MEVDCPETSFGTKAQFTPTRFAKEIKYKVPDIDR
jgi:hypothetical protein